MGERARREGNRLAQGLVILCAGFLLPFSMATAGDLEDGLAAYQEKDYARTFLLLAPLADRGDSQAEFVLGEMYRKGEGLAKSAPDALPLLTKAAEAGHAGAQNALGQMYESGDGVDQNFDTALQWFRRAACRCVRARPAFQCRDRPRCVPDAPAGRPALRPDFCQGRCLRRAIQD